MRPLQPVVVSGVASSAWLILDQYLNVANLNIEVDAGGSTVQVDYTNDNVFNVAAPVVNPGGTPLVASGATSTNTNTTQIPFAVRLTCTVFVAAATMKVTQHGLTGA